MGRRKYLHHQNPSGARKRSRKSKVARLRWQALAKKNNEQLAEYCTAEHDYVKPMQCAITPTNKSISFLDMPGPSGLQKLVELDEYCTNTSEETSVTEIIELPIKIEEPREITVEAGEHTPPNAIPFISEEEYNSIMDHKLHIEVDHTPKESTVLSGNCVVDFRHVVDWSINLQYNHSKVCTSGKLFLKDECRRGLGLVSCFIFACTMCDKEYKHCTEDITKF